MGSDFLLLSVMVNNKADGRKGNYAREMRLIVYVVPTLFSSKCTTNSAERTTCKGKDALSTKAARKRGAQYQSDTWKNEDFTP
eukprot:329307-Amphidinium_carterae.2